MHSVLEAANGTLWIGAENGLKVLQNDSTYTHSPLNALIPSNSILALAEDKDLRLWIGTEVGLSFVEDSLLSHEPRAVNLRISRPAVQIDGCGWRGGNQYSYVNARPLLVLEFWTSTST